MMFKCLKGQHALEGAILAPSEAKKDVAFQQFLLTGLFVQ